MKVTRLSWSRESRYEKCGQQYVYIYEEKLKRPPGVALVRGMAPHRSAEADLKAKLEGGQLLHREAVAEVATGYVETAFRGEVLIDGEFEGLTVKQAKDRCRQDARKMAWWHHDHISPGIVPTAVELRVRATFPELPVPYEGVIDVIDRDAVVRDLKTKTKAPEKTLADTSEQLTVYWGLFSAWYKRAPTELALDVLWVTPTGDDKGKTLVTSRGPKDWTIRIARTLRFVEAVEREVFLPCAVDHWACSPRWCGYTDICPFYAGRPRPTT